MPLVGLGNFTFMLNFIIYKDLGVFSCPHTAGRL